MSYIGSTPTTQNFIAGTDQFTGNGSATNWTLSRQVNSPNDIEVVIANVVQNPTSYSVSGNTLTVSPAIGNGTAFYVRYLSTTLQSITIPPGTTVNGNWGVNGNLNFFGNARRITGDFSNATVANRVMFQTSTVNGITNVAAIPNGTGVVGGFSAFNNSDPTNAAFISLATTTGAEARVTSGITGTGTYRPMTFYTGGSERMRVDTSGNVGIGTSSPSSPFQVHRDSASFVNIKVSNSVTGSGILDGVDLVCGTSGEAYLYNRENQPLIFGTNNTERARIDASGNLLVGATSAVGTVVSVSSASSTCAFFGKSGTTTNATFPIILRNSADTNMLFVRSDGLFFTGQSTFSPYNNTTASAANVFVGSDGFLYRSTSSLKYKTNVQDSTHGLVEVMSLRPVTYKGNNDGDKVFGGLIAEEVHEAGLTEFVQYAEDGTPDALAYGNMVSICIKAIQEQQQMIDELKAKVAALENA
jgi:hypothetical protein